MVFIGSKITYEQHMCKVQLILKFFIHLKIRSGRDFESYWRYGERTFGFGKIMSEIQEPILLKNKRIFRVSHKTISVATFSI